MHVEYAIAEYAMSFFKFVFLVVIVSSGLFFLR